MADKEDKDAKDTIPKEPEAKEPGYYSKPTTDVGATKSLPNEVKQAGTAAPGEEVDYESMTVPELKDLAASRGIEVQSDWLKHDIITALKQT
jgi:hypothetical protein